ncbi:MAG: restriction endonuclease subunit S [Propionibacteriaceae bacterium]|nr:restriction endonuclease subunit S [Propionibacteriaceae bacterium]
MLSGKFYRFRVTEDVESAFLEAWLLSPDAQNDIDGMKTGISESGLNLTQARFLDLRVPLPPLDEQRGIVAILEDHLAHLDVAGSRLSRASSQVDTLVTNILLDLIPDARDYPSDWTMSTVGQAGKVELGRQRHPDWHVGPNMHPYLRVANVFEDRLDLSDVMQMHWPEGSFERFRLKPGDILLNEGQSPQFLGRPAIYQGDPPDIAFTNSLLRFQANENVLPEFALLVFRRQMRAGRFSSESRITTNIAHLSAGRLKVVEFPIPPLREQRRLVRRAGELLYGAERLSDHFTTINQYQTALRRSLLATAFRGDLISGSISRNK